MVYRVLADLVVLLHLAFVAFVVLGGLLVLRRARWAWAHLPVAAWGAMVELTGWVCPLTPLELRLRALGGERGYSGGFVEHYILPVLYPSGLSRGHQVLLGLLVLGLNLGIYLRAWARHRTPEKGGISSGGEGPGGGRGS